MTSIPVLPSGRLGMVSGFGGRSAQGMAPGPGRQADGRSRGQRSGLQERAAIGAVATRSWAMAFITSTRRVENHVRMQGSLDQLGPPARSADGPRNCHASRIVPFREPGGKVMCHRGESSLSCTEHDDSSNKSGLPAAKARGGRGIAWRGSPGLVDFGVPIRYKPEAQAKENHNMNTPSLALQACGSFSRGLHPWLGLYAMRRETAQGLSGARREAAPGGGFLDAAHPLP